MTNELYEKLIKETKEQIEMQKNFMQMIKEENEINEEKEKMTREYFTEIEKYY